jgi:hypothetical protein
MLPEIKTLQDRMSKGGNWIEFREEIADLHKRATHQSEFSILMESFAYLMSVGPSAFDSETWTKVEKAARSEYLLFLLSEGSNNSGNINPILYDYITAREVEAGRLDPNSDVRAHAIAGRVGLGDTSDLESRPPRPGNWLAAGFAIAGVILWLVGVREPLSPLWLLPVCLLLGWIPNELARKRIVKEAKLNRQARGYPI